MTLATLANFRVQFPEFASADDTLVQAWLDAAALEIDEDVWGDKAPQGHMYLAAHKLALSPYGQAARLAKSATDSTYNEHFTRLVGLIACGRGRVV